MTQTILQQVQAGQKLDNFVVIDAHAHLGQWPQIHTAYGNAQDILASMDRIGVQSTCISAFQALGGDVQRGNDSVGWAVNRHPGRFIGYGTLNPLFPGEIVSELDRCLDSLGLWAIKLHPTAHNNTPPDDPVYHTVYTNLQERKGVVLSHTFGSPSILDKLSNQYPDVVFIYAHVGATFDAVLARELSPLMKERDNLYIDTCLSVVPYGHIERWVKLAGSDKLLFGSDVPFNDNAHQIGRITHARISDQDKKKILGLNMLKLLQRTGGWAV
jgi:predicted TIM-barrel fold metal-dependent hydrolase